MCNSQEGENEVTNPLWADLINSDWHDRRGSGRTEDRLCNDGWLGAFLGRFGWRGPLPDDTGRARLRELRAVLRRSVEALMADRALPAAQRAELNRALADVVASFARVLVEGDPNRIKSRENPDCRWVMYDESRSRTRRWCEAADCGNLIKVRRFRERRRAAGGQDRRRRGSDR